MRWRLSLCAVLLIELCRGAASAAPVVTLGPEINVSAKAGLDPGLNEYQTDLRCSPLDPLHMMITCKLGVHETETMTFRSADGGKTWSSSPVLTNSGDPDCVYAGSGQSIWSFINNSPASLGVRISMNWGVTWSATVMADSVKIDHPQMICDRSAGAFAGSIYVAGRPMGMNGYDVVRTRDEGRTFAKTHISCEGALSKGFVELPAVLNEGTLIIPIMSGSSFLTKDGNYAGNERSFYCLRSSDGGVTFGIPVLIAPFNSPAKTVAGGAAETGGFAVGRWRDGQRVYFTFSQGLPDMPDKLMLVTSDDGGVSWSMPRSIVSDAAPGRGAGSSSVMVNKKGVVGIQYYALDQAGNFDIYFTASVDGGETFSVPTRVSSATSCQPHGEPRWAGQDQVYADASTDGVFHLVWTDARDSAKAYQVYCRSAMVAGGK